MVTRVIRYIYKKSNRICTRTYSGLVLFSNPQLYTRDPFRLILVGNSIADKRVHVLYCTWQCWGDRAPSVEISLWWRWMEPPHTPYQRMEIVTIIQTTLSHYQTHPPSLPSPSLFSPPLLSPPFPLPLLSSPSLPSLPPPSPFPITSLYSKCCIHQRQCLHCTCTWTMYTHQMFVHSSCTCTNIWCVYIVHELCTNIWCVYINVQSVFEPHPQRKLSHTVLTTWWCNQTGKQI